ncbi:MAG: hypothetical protein WCA20_06460 [Candidatus Sulfotelmatobacter sp.]
MPTKLDLTPAPRTLYGYGAQNQILMAGAGSAQSGRADLLLSGDQDLLILAGQTTFLIETPEAYRRRTSEAR